MNDDFYHDGQNDYFVCDGMTEGTWFGTFTRLANGSLRLMRSEQLPMRRRRSEAEADLARWAQREGFQRFEPSPPEGGRRRAEG